MAVVKYPLFFEESYMPYIWGGRRLETMLGKRLPASGIYAESWEISTRREGESKIRNGAFAGKTLTELVA
ncbi:class I mannose-6-phosphate isomerase, partial [candidate division KSB1 bacterium]|nr:class I mannose-6-phosphate isomerase [candidate division KSB1 bacterium]